MPKWVVDGFSDCFRQANGGHTVDYSPDIFSRKIHVLNEIAVEIEARGKLDMFDKLDELVCRLPVIFG